MIKLYPLDKYVACHFQKETVQFHNNLNEIWSTVNYEMIESESFDLEQIQILKIETKSI